MVSIMIDKKTEFPEYEIRAVDDLVPYARNSRTHSDKQVAEIAASIKEFGFTNPILIDGEGGIIAGHCRLMALQKLGVDEVPCVKLEHLTEAQKRAYVIADNKLAEKAGWDEDLLKIELADLKDAGFDLSVTGFEDKELENLFGDDDDSQYTRKVEAPTYDPAGVQPNLDDLYSDAKTAELIAEIDESKVTPAEKAFLKRAAGRHTAFDFQKVADYYAHASPEMQNLMENSALIIVDFGKAIANGYVKVNEEIAEQYLNERKNSDE